MTHAQLLRLLMPAPYDIGGERLAAELDAEARVLDSTQAQAGVLLTESDPRTTAALLAGSERVTGLPDTCVGAGQSFAERRDQVVQRITAQGGGTPAYFVQLAARMGYTVTVTEFSAHTCEDDCETPVADEVWRLAWQVNSALDTIREATCEDDCEMPLRVWGNARLECGLSRYAPAHGVLIFAYS
jgi:uncharacterized protein YmfQ (DUF2313 family)